MSDAGDEARSIAGGCLAAIGVLIAFLSGGCTLMVLVASKFSWSDASNVLSFGLPFTFVGLVLMLIGLFLKDEPRVSTPPDGGSQND